MSRREPTTTQKNALATVVVLRFSEGMKIEIVKGLSEKAAIADVAARALSNGAVLPLIEAKTSEIPTRMLVELVGTYEPPPPPAERPAIPISGLVHAVAAYVKTTQGKAPKILNARDALRDFFAHYGCPVDFAGEPEPPAEDAPV